jgi:hypothetical protein
MSEAGSRNVANEVLLRMETHSRSTHAIRPIMVAISMADRVLSS